MMAYRTSVHESTEFTPQYLVFGEEANLPIDLTLPAPISTPTKNYCQFVQDLQSTLRKSHDFARTTLHEKQERRNSLYSEKVHGPTYSVGQQVFLYVPVISKGLTSKFSSLWKGPFEIVEILNDVNYRIKDLQTNKEQIVHYDRLKPCHPGTVFKSSDSAQPPPSPQTVTTAAEPPEVFYDCQCELSDATPLAATASEPADFPPSATTASTPPGQQFQIFSTPEKSELPTAADPNLVPVPPVQSPSSSSPLGTLLRRASQRLTSQPQRQLRASTEVQRKAEPYNPSTKSKSSRSSKQPPRK